MLKFTGFSIHILVAVATSIFLVSCGVPIINDPGPCKLPGAENQLQKTEPLDLDILIVGSGSMLGFVNAGGNSRYAKTLNLLESLFELGVPTRAEINKKYYRAGQSLEGEINQELSKNIYRQAQSRDFYIGKTSQFTAEFTSQLADAIYPPEKNDKLSVIITDLQQSQDAVTVLNAKIEKAYLKKDGYAVAVIGMRGEYKGTVYFDSPIYRDFIYDTSTVDNLEEMRPFYLILMGPYSDVSFYVEEFQNKGGQIARESEIVIFYPGNPVSQVSHFQSLPRELPQGVNRPFSLQNKQVSLEVSSPPYELLEILPWNQDSEITLPYQTDYQPLEYLLPIHNLRTRITAYKFDEVEENFIEDLSLRRALEVKDWYPNNDLEFTTVIKQNNLNEPGIYVFTVDAEVSNLEQLSWWQEWDWESSKTSNQDGSKTDQLLTFMNNLKRTTEQLMAQSPQPPIIGRFCFAIQKN